MQANTIVCCALSGDKKGISYYIDGKRLIIGRSNNAEVQILDEKASREHAEIARVQSNFIVTDLSSQNGVVVNDLKNKTAPTRTWGYDCYWFNCF